MKSCKVCGNTQNNHFVVAKEMMFGFRDEFQYMECDQCKCIQIVEIPKDISRYYPDNYYSYLTRSEEEVIQTSFAKTLKRTLKKNILNYYLQGNGPISRWVTPKFSSYYPWIKKNMLHSRSAILDVGCGSGELLLRMYNDGFRNLTGLDPFIASDIHYKCGIHIYQKSLSDLTGTFDLIMMHHAFEHMDAPLDVLKTLVDHLNPGGHIIIRIPVGDCYAWKKYGVKWVQLDAPRHYFIHTKQSMQLLSSQAGLEYTDVVYDSYQLQFTGSEKYLQDIPLVDPHELFTAQQIEEFNQEAQRLNSIQQGDAACFYLRKN